MVSISEIKNTAYNINKYHDNRCWNLIKLSAEVIDSRESTYRTALDIVAFDIPTMLAGAFRNFWNFLEATLEAGIGTLMVIGAPQITGFIGKLMGKIFLQPTKEEQDNALNYLKFQMKELQDNKKLQEGLERIKNEEPKDKKRVSDFNKDLNNKEKVETYEKEAKGIEEFCQRFKPDKDTRDRIYKLKRATILTESFVEGGIWGSFGLIIRAFRKYVLRKERFTGTMGYLSDTESQSLGEGGELNLFQRIGGIGAMLLSPILNTYFLKKTKDPELIKKSRFFSIVDRHLDMTHGVFPKLGLLFSYTSIPKWTGIFITSQGWYERIERMVKFCTILPSWWLGHRVTNGRLALNADNELAKKYNIQGGILVDKNPDEKITNLEKIFPEPARIQHVLDSIEKLEKDGKINKETMEKLRQEATDKHAKCLYGGFALHSFLVWVITMAVNYTTKLRAMHALGK